MPGEAAAAFLALSFDDTQEAVQVLVRAAASDDWMIRRLAAEALGEHSRGGAALTALRALLHDPSEYVVRTACEALGRLGDAESHDAVASLLRAPQSHSRRVALIALRTLWEPGDFEQVLGIMGNDAEDEVRKEAGWTLREWVSEATWAVLFDLWSRDSLVRHRIWACELVEQFGGPVQASALTTLTADSDGHVREAAMHALQGLGLRLIT